MNTMYRGSAGESAILPLGSPRAPPGAAGARAGRPGEARVSTVRGCWAPGPSRYQAGACGGGALVPTGAILSPHGSVISVVTAPAMRSNQTVSPAQALAGSIPAAASA